MTECLWCGGLVTNGACQDCGYQPDRSNIIEATQ